MSPDTVKKMIEAAIPDSQVETSGEDCTSTIVVISPVFAGLSPIKCHRMVNDIFKAQFASGELHALSIKTKVA
ncbi:BolA family protein [Thiomicrorhabdus arctica]|jgi:acid stress-induced BolA-like protein IbaG/YrbA|uniref:BolA family protein n=1 Tax=Thiomicrorhabdus arctica TaxID=131540 RepID=UPI00037C3ACD|nr:BolA/IbaG family iron-sulfur metabolism protein [Thiomicrorhabdus arctica]